MLQVPIVLLLGAKASIAAVYKFQRNYLNGQTELAELQYYKYYYMSH